MINLKLKKNFFDFYNQNIYVIGGSGLIGSEIISDLIHYDANVINLDIKNHKKKIISNHKNYKFIYTDISKQQKENFNFTQLFQDYGDPNILINCSYPRDEMWAKNNFIDIHDESFKKNIDLHLISYSLTAKNFANSMLKKKINGNILLFASIYGFLGQDLSLYQNTKMKENMTYSVIKGGIVNLVRQMSSFYGKYNIRVNAISPGGIYGHEAGKKNIQNKKFIENYSKKTPLNRLCYPNEVSKLALYIISSKASYISGSNLIIDGGISIV